MRLWSLLLLAIAAGCGGSAPQPAPGEPPSWAGPRQGSPTGRLDRKQAGKPAPDLAFEDPDGEPASLADFRGGPLLVNLWATWCAPCVAELPTLDALAAREGEKLRVLAVSEDLDGREKVERFFAERGYEELEPYLDGKMELMTALGVSTLPTTILYDADGREVWRMTGYEDWRSEKMAALLEEARPR